MQPQPPQAPKNFESRVQDLVYNVDVGVGLHVIKGGLYILMLFAILALYTASQFWGLKEAEAMDQAQIARQLMDEGAFNTKVIRPAAVWLYATNGIDPRTVMLKQPDITHPPLYPAALSVAFRMIGDSFDPARKFRTFPPEQWAIIPLGHLCTLLTGLVMFLMARRFFERRIAVVAISLFFLSDFVWANSISGLNIGLAGLMAILCLFFAMIGAERYIQSKENKAWMLYLLLAAVCGALTLLTRYSAGWVLLAALLVIGMQIPGRGWSLGGAVVGLALVLAFPWFLRNYLVCGQFFGFTPYLALNGIEPAFTQSFERMINPNFSTMGRDLQTKWLVNFREFYQTALPAAGSGIIVAFFIVTFFFRFARAHVNALRIGLLAAIVPVLVVAGFFGEGTLRTLAIFWPLVILYGTSFFYILLDRLQLTIPIFRTALISAVITLTALPLLFTFMPPRAGYPYPPYYPSYTTLITQMIQPDELLCTDMPWATAWYGNTSSLLLPATLREFYEIHDLKKRVSGIYFTTLTRDLPYTRTLMTGPYSTWFPIFNERLPVNFPLGEAFFLSGRDQLFLTDRPRWPQ